MIYQSKTTIPQGWQLIKLGDVIELQYGKSLIKSKRDGGAYLVYGSNGVVGSHSKFLIEKSCLIVGRKGTIGEVTFSGSPCWAIDTTYYIDKLYEQPIKFWFYRLKALELDKLDRASAIPGLNREDAYKLIFPLPPLNEQKRIVAKIEALQTRSTAVKEELEAIKPLLDQFRQSVLAAAFRGDLTKDWREQNIDTAWENTTLESVIKDKPRNGYSPKAVDHPTQVKSFSLSATTSGVFKPEYFKYIDKEIEQNSYLWLKPGDVLIQRSNTLEYVGTSAIYTSQFGDFIYPDTVMKIQVNEDKATNKFIHYSLSNKKTRQYFKDNATGTAGNMPKINQKTVMNTPISLPSIEEQKEIVCRIESLFKLADSIQNQQSKIQNQIETLNQSILAKAFRGELVPQDPNDEPASVLLEKIKAEREKAKPNKSKSKKKSKTTEAKQLGLDL